MLNQIKKEAYSRCAYRTHRKLSHQSISSRTKTHLCLKFIFLTKSNIVMPVPYIQQRNFLPTALKNINLKLDHNHFAALCFYDCWCCFNVPIVHSHIYVHTHNSIYTYECPLTHKHECIMYMLLWIWKIRGYKKKNTTNNTEASSKISPNNLLGNLMTD